jgi:translation initiation factor IF-2
MLDTVSNESKDNPESAELKVVHSGVGEINETDVLLASAGNSIIIGFNIRPTTQAIKVAKHEGVEIKTYRTIYDLTDDVKNILKGLEVKKEKEEFLGRALVKKVFNITKFGKVAGCVVEEGKILRNAKVRVLRDNVIISETKISSLKRFKEDVKEVEKGYECGIGLENLSDIKENDVIESYQIVTEN